MIQGRGKKVGNRKRAFTVFVVFCIFFSLLSTVFVVRPAQAQAARAAIVVEVKGDVSVKRAGGSKSYTVYEDMSLNQGDLISTGGSSSVVLKIADRGDEMTIGENAEVYISDLVNQGSGKTSKFKVWAGSVWTRVKSLVGSEDEFDVETPTATMGVRGTLFLINVDRMTGQTTLAVGSGVVRVTTTAPSASEGSPAAQTSRFVTVYPSQQFSTDTRVSAADPRGRVDTADIGSIVRMASPRVIEAMLHNTLEMQQENEQIRQTLLENLNRGQQKPDEQSILRMKDLEDLAKVAQNFDRFMPNLAQEALAQGKTNPRIIDEANKRIEDPLKRIDLNQWAPLDNQAGMDSELQEVLRQANPQYVKEQEQLRNNQDRLGDLLNKLENDRNALAAANTQLLTDQSRMDLNRYIAGLSPEERKRVEEAVNRNQGSNPASSMPAPAGGGHKGSGRPSGPSTIPDAPIIVSPTGEMVTSAPVVAVKAPMNSLVKILNHGTVIAQANGNGDQEVRISLNPLITEEIAVYDQLMAVTELNGVQSLPVGIAKLTVDGTPAIFLSPVIRQNQSVTANMMMRNFIGTKAFYAVEVHLLYDNRLSYEGNGSVTRNADTVFGAQPHSIEVLKQTRGASSSELVYAATGMQPAGTDGIQFEVRGEHALVSIPLTLAGPDSKAWNVKLTYYKVVDQEGNVVAEFDSSKSPIAVPVN